MNTITIHVFAEWQVKDGSINDVLTALEEVAKNTREEPGNLFYRIHQSMQDPNTIVLFEGYTDESALQQHRSSAHFQTLVVGRIVSLLENRKVIITRELEV